MKYGAQIIYNQVITAMQDAEEIGGVEGDEYLNLMLAIRDEAMKRFDNCIDNWALDKEANINSH
jgi:hypothetical protein